MTPLEPLTIRAAIPAAIGAARPVWTRAGIVMNPSVAEANTQGAIGSAQLNARVLERLDAAAVGASPVATGADSVVPRAAASVTVIAATTSAAATANDTSTPKSPAPAINPPANGPMANPAISTAPAVAAPAGPLRSEAHAVPEVIARPTPTPTIKRPGQQNVGVLGKQHRNRADHSGRRTGQRDCLAPERIRGPPADEQAGQQTPPRRCRRSRRASTCSGVGDR